ncbi:MAG: hypothetical protein K5905_06700 [Roseibium sp.]|uniref:SH3 domain-containing protein n=1 Tax=Roseibium sp. TaxID=1936156 RepID=UPI0026275FE6|nr:SH3 domain-containing protein [Roseibium sp.]MCV0425142.1 hypothetical protein [Roseibium sp.]
MYYVNVPAASCDEEQGHRTDDATNKNNKTDLKLVSNSEGSSDTGEEIQPFDPSEIAAKILQMHASADEVKAAASREPKMVWGQEDTSFEIPGVLRRPRETDTYAGLQPEPVPEVAQPSRKTGSFLKGPSSIVLVCCALVALAAGGTAAIFTLSGPSGQEAAVSRAVETEAIATEPATDNIVATAASENSDDIASTSTIVAPEMQQVAGETVAATPQQIAKAKDRIRDAFATGNSGAPATSSQEALTSSDQPVETLADQAQLRLEQGASTAEAPLTASTPDNLPVIASTAESVPIPDNLIPTSAGATEPQSGSQTPVVNTPEPGPGLQAPLAEATSSEPAKPVETAAALPSDPSYPNAATTSASVNMRQSEEKNAKIIAVIPQNTQVQFNECGKWWCGVSYDGKTGFVGEKYLVRSTQPE